jgi:Spy/CpxP family protein refolding chaperone
MRPIGRRRLVVAGALAIAAAAPAAAAPAPAPNLPSAELDQLTQAWRRLLGADDAPSLSDAQIDAIRQQRDALLERILAFQARSAADVLAKLRVADLIDPFADAAEEGDVKAIWALSAMADLERLTGQGKRSR